LEPQTTVKTRQIAETLEIPEHFLGKVMSQLVKKKLVSSAKGPSGGFALAVDPNKITLYRILATLDGLSVLEEDCVMGLNECSESTPCALHNYWVNFRAEAVQRAQKLTLTELADTIVRKLDFKGIGKLADSSK
ncbi:Rrf2 family transcriptional regulator, partial [Gemmatimonas aurantiaca]|nr:Rrf2 family transcriptional regulator [Gemmatimonas aurantiaca]